MQPIQIVQEKKISYNEFGHCTSSEETYIKLSSSLKELLATLKGARLSAFLALALNESEMSLGHSHGLSLYDIEAMTDFSDRHVLRAMQFLTANHYAVETAEHGPHGEKLYRVCNYAWFGNHPASVPASNRDAKHSATALASNKSTKPSAASNSAKVRRSDKMSPPDTGVTPLTSCHDDDLDSNLDDSKETSSCHDAAQVEKILRAAGFKYSAPSIIAGWGVSVKTAQAWADWVPDGGADEKIGNPWGMAYRTLEKDKNALPPSSRENGLSDYDRVNGERLAQITGKKKIKNWWGDEYDKFVKR